MSRKTYAQFSINLINTYQGATAYWFCVGSSGSFQTTEPDRSECKHEWVEEVEEKVKSI